MDSADCANSFFSSSSLSQRLFGNPASRAARGIITRRFDVAPRRTVDTGTRGRRNGRGVARKSRSRRQTVRREIQFRRIVCPNRFRSVADGFLRYPVARVSSSPGSFTNTVQYNSSRVAALPCLSRQTIAAARCGGGNFAAVPSGGTSTRDAATAVGKDANKRARARGCTPPRAKYEAGLSYIGKPKFTRRETFY